MKLLDLRCGYGARVGTRIRIFHDLNLNFFAGSCSTWCSSERRSCDVICDGWSGGGGRLVGSRSWHALPMDARANTRWPCAHAAVARRRSHAYAALSGTHVTIWRSLIDLGDYISVCILWFCFNFVPRAIKVLKQRQQSSYFSCDIGVS